MDLLKNQQAAETVDGIYIDLETRLMQNIAKHLRDWKQPIASDEWLIKKLAEIGKLNKENIAIIAKMSGLSFKTTEQMLNAVAESVIEDLEPGFKKLVKEGYAKDAVAVSKSKNIKQVMNSMTSQAKDKLNLTNTTMLHKAQESFRYLATTIAQESLEIMNKNAASMITGAEARQQVLEKAIKQFAKKGITGFVDKRGREWTPEAYINMVIRTTSGNVAHEVQTARQRDYGIKLIEISSHSGARPKCAVDQGKIYALDNSSGKTTDARGREVEYFPWNSTSYGEPDGILGINCTHNKFSFVEGVSIQRYFPTENFEKNKKLYKQTQVQRAMERDIRKQKRECMLYDDLGDKEAFERSSVMLKAKEKKLEHYISQHEFLHRRTDREKVVGYSEKLSAMSNGAAKKHFNEWTKSIGAESGPANLAEYYDLKYNESEESRIYKGYVDAVKKGRISPIVGFDTFKDMNKKISEELDGLTIASGVSVKGHTAHFVDRMIGTHDEMTESDNKELKKRLNHAAVTVEEAKQAITQGTPGMIVTDSKGRRSQRFVGEKCVVTFNPDTQELIQTNRR